MLDEDAAATVATAYALGAGAVLSGPVARGEQGQVWRLDSARGAFAVKELFMRQTPARACADADFQDAARAAVVPMPGVVRTRDGEVLTQLESAQVRVYEWVDLLGPDLGLDPAAVGRVLAAIHQVRVPAGGAVDAWHTEPVGAPRWDELLRLLDASGAPFTGDLAHQRDEMVAAEALLEPPSDLQVCHCDLWADNVLGTPAGGVCVIDWENCGPADPSQELAMVVSEFAYANAGRARALYDAYLGAGGPGRIDRPGNFSMAVATLHHIVEYDCENWLNPETSPADRDRTIPRVAEYTDRPLTPAVIDGLLAALTD